MSEFESMIQEAKSHVTIKKGSENPKHYIVFDKTELEIDGTKKSLIEWYDSVIKPTMGNSTRVQAEVFIRLILKSRAEKSKTERKPAREKPE